MAENETQTSDNVPIPPIEPENPNNTTPLPNPDAPILLNLPIATKLNRTNYLTWKSQIEPILHGYRIYRYITNPPPAPTVTNSGNIQVNPIYISWHSQDQLILGWLRSSLTESLQTQVLACATSRELWDSLKSTFSSSSRARLTELRRQFQNTAKGGLTCADYVQKMRSIADELSFIGSPVSEEDLVVQILNGLGADYNAFVIAATTRSENLTFSDVQSMLLTHEALLNAQTNNSSSLPSAQNPTAFYSNPKANKPNNYKNNSFKPPAYVPFSQPFRPRFSQTNYRPPLLPTPNYQQKPNQNLPNPPTGPNICQICYKKGHTARTCYKRCDARYFDPPMQPPQAFVAQPVTATPEPPIGPPVADWVIDSGASHHVTNDLNALSSFLPYEGINALQIGDGSGMKISHIGSLSIHISSFSIQLNDVLFVPNFTKNLLSLSRLLYDNNLLIEFSSQFCLIKDRASLTPLLQAKLIRGLYCVSLPPPPSPQALLVSADLWHSRLGHPSSHVTLQVLQSNKLPCSSFKFSFCPDCNMSKSHKLPFSSSLHSTTSPLELVHSDVWGPAPIISNDGFKYYVLFVDDFTKYTWIYFLHSKDEVSKVFSLFKLQAENILNTTIKTLRTDGGTEYKPITRLFPQINHQTSCPYTPEQNGLAERKHRHVIELSLAIISKASLPLLFWPDVFSSAVFLINRLPNSSTSKSPYQLLFHKTPDYSHLKTLGCLCFPLTKPYNSHKLQQRSVPCIFIGYPSGQKGYKCFHKESNRTFISKHVTFDETTFPFSQVLHDSVPPTITEDFSQWFPAPLLKNLENENTQLPSTTITASTSIHSTTPPSAPLPHDHNDNSTNNPDHSNQSSTYDNSSLPIPATSPPATSAHPMVTRSRDNTRRPRTFPDHVAYITTSSLHSEPSSFSQAKSIPHWQQAMQEEINALHRNNTWTLVAPLPDQNVVDCKWVYRIKQNADGSIARYKARLVAKGFSQQEGVDYFDTFSPVVRPSTIRIVLSLALSKGWSLKQLDVQNAFLHGDLQETVFMRQPPGFVDSAQPNHVCRLHKALYGLKQSPRAWFHTLSTALTSYGFVGSKYDPSLFIYNHHNRFMVLLVYIDDIILAGSDTSLISHLLTTLKSSFAIKDLGTLHYFLGIEVTRTPHGLHLSQSKYIKDLLTRSNMHNSKPYPSPMPQNLTLSKFVGDPVDNPHLYRTIVGALQYATITRPEIAFAVNKVSQFMHNPTDSHWTAVKRILRYLQGSPLHGLNLRADSNLSLHAFSDSDWAGCPDDRRSTSGYCIYLGPNIVSWSSKKQLTVARSSTEAEYKAIAHASAELMWVQYILLELQILPTEKPALHCDNIGATYLASNPMFNARTKHIEIDYHFVREQVVKNRLSIHFLSSKNQIADIFTKPLGTARFITLRDKLTVTTVPSTCKGGVKNTTGNLHFTTTADNSLHSDTAAHA